MSSVRVCVTFMVGDIYEYDDADWENEEEYIERAQEELLSDFNLSAWQGEWANTLVDWEHDDG